MDTISLGGLTVSAQGLGCMGMSEAYGTPDWDGSIATIRRALDLGVTLIDTADTYGAGHNEVLVGRAIAGRRDEVQLATKVGIDRSGGDDAWRIRGERAYVKRGCEASLLRLGVDVIDLYYLHRPSPETEIEESVGAMAELVAEGKVRHLGLSEVDDALLRRAHAVHPISAVQSEYSLWTRDPEDEVLPTLRELGIGFVPYSPLGRGFLTGQIRSVDDLDEDDWRRTNPRFQGEAFAENLRLADRVAELAEGIGATPAQVALAWVLAKGDDLVPIPGTKSPTRLEENVAATDLHLSDAQVAELDAAVSRDAVRGPRYDDSGMAMIGN